MGKRIYYFTTANLTRFSFLSFFALVFSITTRAQNDGQQVFYWDQESTESVRQDLFTRSNGSATLMIPLPGNPVVYDIHPYSFIELLSENSEKTRAYQSFTGTDGQGGTLYGFYYEDRLHLSYNQNGRLFAVSPVENEVSKYYLTSGEPEIPGEIECAVMDIPGNKTRRGGNSIACQNQNYQNWSFRLFVACTGEFGNHLGSKPNASLAIVRLVSHMNSFYTNEMGIHFTLVLDDRFIYTDSSEDPFSPESSSPNLAEQARRFFRDSVDAGLYDLGHVMHKLSTSSGNLLGSGIAYLRSLCDGTYKGGGWTGTSHPGNLNFTLNILGHEIGHQLGADHSFYGSLGNCSGTNRRAENGFEPGAGSTMMSYESNCGSHNLDGPPSQFFYFNTHSYNQILQFINVQNCGNRTGSASIPSVQIPGNFSVPINTAFDLTANASGSYLFNWEQYDTDGGSGHSHPIDGGKYQGTPMYRSYDPSGTGYHRSFPAKEVQRGSPYNGEVWATVARDITLRLTTRNGGTIRCDEMTVTVRNAPAFKILEPLRNAVIDLAETPTRANSETMTVRWETGDTETNGFPTIDILYSIDGGVSFPYLLADDVPNTGEYEVRPPEIETGQARLKILLSDGSGQMAIYHENRGNFTVSFSPLPIEIARFTGQIHGEGHLLSWELNNTGEHVESVHLEYSYDGVIFQAVPLNGFEVLNREPGWAGEYISHFNQSSRTYYRMVIRDATGHKTYSAVIALENESADDEFLTLFPNPASHETQLKFNSFLHPDARIRVWSINGRKMNEVKPALRTRSLVLPLYYPDGLYIVEVDNGGEFYREKVLISR